MWVLVTSLPVPGTNGSSSFQLVISPLPWSEQVAAARVGKVMLDSRRRVGVRWSFSSARRRACWGKLELLFHDFDELLRGGSKAVHNSASGEQ